MNFENAVRIARTVMQEMDLEPGEAVASVGQLIPDELREAVVQELERQRDFERALLIQDPFMLENRDRHHRPWLSSIDRQSWYYWPRFRALLLDASRPGPAIDALDDTTDLILGALEEPTGPEDFSTRGLVIGFVQSGKTENYTALVAKAADCGFRLFIVLSGVYDSLRQQTQRRLNTGLVGDQPGGVTRPPDERLWMTFTTTELKGDFDPGTADANLLVREQPALFVVKKRVPVLDRLIRWLRTVPAQTLRAMPILVIDDEADQASINTGGNRALLSTDGLEAEDDFEEADEEVVQETGPSATNERIRTLLGMSNRVAYIGYTATPQANVLIEPTAEDRYVGRDLYPRDFILALRRPVGAYSGPEELFGLPDDPDSTGMDVIRRVPDDDAALLVPVRRRDVPAFQPQMAASLRQAIDDFVLAGAARYQRGQGEEPATMLIHTDYRQVLHARLYDLVSRYVQELRNEWRYDRANGIEHRLERRWESEFRPVTRSLDLDRDVPFDDIRGHINDFLEHPLQTLQINSSSEDILDYQRDPGLKAVVIGGNRLSRGLTLEGLLISYYIRRTIAYDTLMQMGRWFGFREGYVDLTRIYLTELLEEWFRDMVAVEIDLRQSVELYDQLNMRPADFGPRLLQHPALLMTNRLKMRAAQVYEDDTTFAGQLIQTERFPFRELDLLRGNIAAAREFLGALGVPQEERRNGQVVWNGVSWEAVVAFLLEYQTHPSAPRVRADLLRSFIRRRALEGGELVRWTVGVMGQRSTNPHLGTIDLAIAGNPEVNAIERTRLRDLPDSLKAIVSAEDQSLGLSDDVVQQIRAEEPQGHRGLAYRAEREPEEGLLLIYPISRWSGYRDGAPNPALRQGRRPIFSPPNPQDPNEAEDVVGIAIAFPTRLTVPPPRTYLVGPAGPPPV